MEDCEMTDFSHLHPLRSGFITPTIVPKPWGHEAWLVVTPYYVFKHLHVNAGHSLSYQYHAQKMETLNLYEGDCIITLHEKDDPQRQFRFRKGHVVHIMPGTLHSFKALTDIILAEVSTPELDDVVRLEDRYGRK